MANTTGKKFGGRTKGTPNKRAWDAREIADRLNCDPLEILLHIANNDHKALGYKEGTVKKVNLGIEYEEELIQLKDRKDAAKEAAKYVYPQLKAIEHSGKDGTDVFADAMVRAQARLEQLKKEQSEKEKEQ